MSYKYEYKYFPDTQTMLITNGNKYISKSNSLIFISWVKNGITYKVSRRQSLIYVSSKCGRNFAIYTSRGNFTTITYKSCNLDIYSGEIYSIRRTSVSANQQFLDSREERIQYMAKELLFNKRKKELRKCVQNFRQKRKRIAMKEGSKYLLPDLCNMIVEML